MVETNLILKELDAFFIFLILFIFVFTFIIHFIRLKTKNNEFLTLLSQIFYENTTIYSFAFFICYLYPWENNGENLLSLTSNRIFLSFFIFNVVYSLVINIAFIKNKKSRMIRTSYNDESSFKLNSILFYNDSTFRKKTLTKEKAKKARLYFIEKNKLDANFPFHVYITRCYLKSVTYFNRIDRIAWLLLLFATLVFLLIRKIVWFVTGNKYISKIQLIIFESVMVCIILCLLLIVYFKIYRVFKKTLFDCVNEKDTFKIKNKNTESKNILKSNEANDISHHLENISVNTQSDNMTIETSNSDYNNININSKNKDLTSIKIQQIPKNIKNNSVNRPLINDNLISLFWFKSPGLIIYLLQFAILLELLLLAFTLTNVNAFSSKGWLFSFVAIPIIPYFFFTKKIIFYHSFIINTFIDIDYYILTKIKIDQYGLESNNNNLSESGILLSREDNLLTSETIWSKLEKFIWSTHINIVIALIIILYLFCIGFLVTNNLKEMAREKILKFILYGCCGFLLIELSLKLFIAPLTLSLNKFHSLLLVIDCFITAIMCVSAMNLFKNYYIGFIGIGRILTLLLHVHYFIRKGKNENKIQEHKDHFQRYSYFLFILEKNNIINTLNAIEQSKDIEKYNRPNKENKNVLNTEKYSEEGNPLNQKINRVLEDSDSNDYIFDDQKLFYTKPSNNSAKLQARGNRIRDLKEFYLNELGRKDRELKKLREIISEVHPSKNSSIKKTTMASCLVGELLNEKDGEFKQLQNNLSETIKIADEQRAEICIKNMRIEDLQRQLQRFKGSCVLKENEILSTKYNDNVRQLENATRELSVFRKKFRDIVDKSLDKKMDRANKFINDLENQLRVEKDKNEKLTGKSNEEISKYENNIILLKDERDKYKKENFELERDKAKYQLQVEQERQKQKLFWENKEFEWKAYQEKHDLEKDIIDINAKTLIEKEREKFMEILRNNNVYLNMDTLDEAYDSIH